MGEDQGGTLRVVAARDEADERPEIKIDHELADVTEEAVEALATDEEVFQRGGMLVHVVRPLNAAKRAGAPVIRELPSAVLRVRLTQAARWMRWDSRTKEWKRGTCPEAIVHAVHARGTWTTPRARVRPLVSVITAPTIRPDGSLLQAAGYDDPTGLLYWPSAKFAAVPEEPTLEDAEVAACTLLDLVRDFPFATDADRSAWLAGVLTIVARPAINGPVPLFAIDGTTRGSGKSRLVDAAVRLACGHDAERTALSHQDEEQRKQITSLLLGGDPVILVDNVASNRKLGGAALDSVLTSVTWKERLLGQTSHVSVPARAVWWATGNNLQLAGDLARRCLKIRLASPLENPEARTDFKYPDLLREIERRRHVLVASALTILRAHAVAGRPGSFRTWGSFESWSRLIPPALTWVGLSNPMDVRATEDESADEERLHAAAVIAALAYITGGEPERAITARELVARLYPTGTTFEEDLPPDPDTSFPAAREALEVATSAKGVPNARAVGQFLRRIVGRVVDGRRVAFVLDAHLKIQRWHSALPLAPEAASP